MAMMFDQKKDKETVEQKPAVQAEAKELTAGEKAEQLRKKREMIEAEFVEAEAQLEEAEAALEALGEDGDPGERAKLKEEVEMIQNTMDSIESDLAALPAGEEDLMGVDKAAVEDGAEGEGEAPAEVVDQGKLEKEKEENYKALEKRFNEEWKTERVKIIESLRDSGRISQQENSIPRSDLEKIVAERFQAILAAEGIVSALAYRHVVLGKLPDGLSKSLAIVGMPKDVFEQHIDELTSAALTKEDLDELADTCITNGIHQLGDEKSQNMPDWKTNAVLYLEKNPHILTEFVDRQRKEMPKVSVSDEKREFLSRTLASSIGTNREIRKIMIAKAKELNLGNMNDGKTSLSRDEFAVLASAMEKNLVEAGYGNPDQVAALNAFRKIGKYAYQQEFGQKKILQKTGSAGEKLIVDYSENYLKAFLDAVEAGNGFKELRLEGAWMPTVLENLVNQQEVSESQKQMLTEFGNVLSSYIQSAPKAEQEFLRAQYQGVLSKLTEVGG